MQNHWKRMWGEIKKINKYNRFSSEKKASERNSEYMLLCMKKEPTEEAQAPNLPRGLTVMVSQAFPSELPVLNQNMQKSLHILPGLGIPCYHSDRVITTIHGGGGGDWGRGHLGVFPEPLLSSGKL